MTEAGPIRHMWHTFEDLGRYERYVLDNTDLEPDETAAVVEGWLADGRAKLIDD